ncbi:MAG: carbohydrate kinase [Bacteroidetes bacterium]|nr:MAG: carbohydrate kinase [Bacteroidota bacterium]
MNAAALFALFEKQTVLVIGDVMTDRYVTGTVSRISPEAPVPVVNAGEETARPGGAANVALNIRALGARAILCSVVGTDPAGDVLLDLLRAAGLSVAGIQREPDRMTTTKARVIANGQHLLRVDREQTEDLSPEIQTRFRQTLLKQLDETTPDVLLLQDYNKGVLTADLIAFLLAEARKRAIPVVVDPKKRHFFAYRGVTLFKPNLKEMRDALGVDIPPEADDLGQACETLRARLGHQMSMITLSEHGIYIHSDREARLIPTRPRNIADVCGAGDTVISIAALGVASGLDLPTIARLANLGGGQVCEKIGVVQVDRDQLAREFDRSVG